MLRALIFCSKIGLVNRFFSRKNMSMTEAYLHAPLKVLSEIPIWSFLTLINLFNRLAYPCETVMVLDCVSIPTVVKALQFTLGFYVYLRVTAFDVIVDVFETVCMDDTHECQKEVHVKVFYFVDHEFHGCVFVKCGSVGSL